MWGDHSSRSEEGEQERARRMLSVVIQAEGDGDLGQGQAVLGGEIPGTLVTDWMRTRREKEE